LRYDAIDVIRAARLQASFHFTIIFIVVVAVVCAAVNAKLSMYDDDPGSRGRITAKSTKLHECSLDRVNITPVAHVIMRLAAETSRPARVDPNRPRPVTFPPYDKSLFLRPPPVA
jgi:hypothetical protein